MKSAIRACALLVGLAAPWVPLGAGRAEPRTTPAVAPQRVAIATLAGGCFWCMEPPFDKLDGVLSTTSGYTGGHKSDPTYEDVSAGATGHAEAVQVRYDPARVSYGKLIEVFWHNVDPVDAGGQFCDRGSQYRSEIFYHDGEQKRLAEKSLKELAHAGRFDRLIATRIVPATTFYPAETYHQDFYKKNPIRYKFYRHSCGRDARLKNIWGPR